MKSAKTMSMWGKSLGVACMLAGALTLGACDKTAKDLMLEADSALQAGELDRAEKTLDEAMKKDSSSFQGPILRSQIYSAKKEYEKAEQELTKLWESRKLDGDKLTTEQKRIRGLMEEEYFPNLYRDWGDAIDAKANPQKYEEVLNKGLKYDKKNPRLNTLLVEFYNQRGEELVAQKKKTEAADIFAKIGELYTTSKNRNEAEARAAALREEVIVEQIDQRFEQELKPKLVAAELYDAENKVAMFVVEGEVDRRATPEDALAASEPLISAQINEAARTLSGITGDVKMGAPTKLTDIYKVVESEFKRGQYKVKGSFPEKELKQYARDLIRREKDAKAAKDGKKAEAPAVKDEKKPAEGDQGTKDASSAPDGKPAGEEKKADAPK